MLAGNRNNNNGSFNNIGNNTFFWSSTENGSNANNMNLNNNNDNVNLNNNNKNYGFSVRCLKDSATIYCFNTNLEDYLF
ncbi:MAG: hypothetical protein GY936_06985 [Ignavibacteriae bacterium]|nr:hypothetical protein [Ignavibacteriota bacterium]